MPYDTPLIVSPLAPLPDHALAAVHFKELPALRQHGEGEAEGQERVCDRVRGMRESALSEPLLQWCVCGVAWNDVCVRLWG